MRAQAVPDAPAERPAQIAQDVIGLTWPRLDRRLQLGCFPASRQGLDQALNHRDRHARNLQLPERRSILEDVGAGDFAAPAVVALRFGRQLRELGRGLESGAQVGEGTSGVLACGRLDDRVQLGEAGVGIGFGALEQPAALRVRR